MIKIKQSEWDKWAAMWPSLAKLVRKYFEVVPDAPTPDPLPEPQPDPPPAPQPEPHPGAALPFATDFLFGWPGGRCDLFQLSSKTTATERQANMDHKQASGYTITCPYMVNTGDGDGKHPVDALHNVEATRWLLMEMRRGGRGVVPIIFSDSHSVSRGNQAKTAARIVQAFDDLVDGWCLYLEPKDTADETTWNATGKAVEAITNKLIFMHTYPAGSNPSAIEQFTKQAWCDGVLVQVSHPSKPIKASEARGVYANLLKYAHGKYVIPFEYSWTSEEKALGDAFIHAGAPGVGDGCSKEAIAFLPQILNVPVSPAPAPEPEPPGPATGLTFKYPDPRNEYVSWGFADRKGWPEVDQGKLCNGLLYAGLGESDMRKVEWIPVGREYTGIGNALDKGGKYYRPEFRPGVSIRLEIRDVNGKVRNADYNGRITL